MSKTDRLMLTAVPLALFIWWLAMTKGLLW